MVRDVDIPVIPDTQRHADEAAKVVHVTYKEAQQPILTIDEAISAQSYFPLTDKPLVVGNPDGEWEEFPRDSDNGRGGDDDGSDDHYEEEGYDDYGDDGRDNDNRADVDVYGGGGKLVVMMRVRMMMTMTMMMVMMMMMVMVMIMMMVVVMVVIVMMMVFGSDG